MVQLLSHLAGEGGARALGDADFWGGFLEVPFAYKLASRPVGTLAQTVRPAAVRLVETNHKTWHFNKLLAYVLDSLKQAHHGLARAAEGAPPQVADCLCLVRMVLLEVIQAVPQGGLGRFVCDPPGIAGQEGEEVFSVLEEVLDEAVGIIAFEAGPDGKRPPGGVYLLQLECVKLLLTMAMPQLFTPSVVSPPGLNPFLDHLVKVEDRCQDLAGALLGHYVAHAVPPKGRTIPVLAPDHKAGLRAMATNLVTAPFWVPVSAYKIATAPAKEKGSPLGTSACLLLTALLHYAPFVPPPPGPHLARKPVQLGSGNPFPRLISGIGDAAIDVGGSPGGAAAPTADFSRLYVRLCKDLREDSSVLLLYSMLHRNTEFLQFVAVRSDVDTLLLPLLEMLCDLDAISPSKLYMVLVILLILSQDPGFSADLHDLIIPKVSFYKARPLINMSMGSILVIVLVRVVRAKLGLDLYLHTNCLAIIANMARDIRHLSSYACQRLISLFGDLHKSYRRQLAGKETAGRGPGNVTPEGVSIFEQKVELYGEFLRILFEIFNVVIVHTLPSNPELVYCLLHRQDVFEGCHEDPRFADLMINVQCVLDFFNSRLQEVVTDGPGTSANEILARIEKASEGWHTNGLHRVSDLKFTYEEDESSGVFFVPYVWNLLVAQSNLPVNAGLVLLFSTGIPAEGGGTGPALGLPAV